MLFVTREISKEQNIILQSHTKVVLHFLYILYSVHTFFKLFSLARVSICFKGKKRGVSGISWCAVYARGSTSGSSSPRDSSSLFSSVLARELRLLWAPMYRVAYTGFVKLVGCKTEQINYSVTASLHVLQFYCFTLSGSRVKSASSSSPASSSGSPS